MTSSEFNHKYKEYLEKGHYGLDLNYPEIVEFLDNKFQELIKIPGFTYSQIKEKFGGGRFYCTNVSREIITEIENKITEMYITLYNEYKTKQ